MKPIIFGIQGTSLSDDEISFFTNHRPYGFILFSRNCASKDQILALTESIGNLFSNRKVPIFIDQEGGRVARIRPPIASKEYPPAKVFGLLAQGEGLETAKIATYHNYYDLMTELLSLGITATCAPVADLCFEGADLIIGDRSFGSGSYLVSELCEAALKGIENAGGQGVIKHIPGHGRASCDSHKALPRVDSSIAELELTDFRVFQLLANRAKIAMTAHIVYSALDDKPATLSKIVIDYIRTKIGFTGILMTDDLSMKALNGDLGDLAITALASGCDIVLHCNGDMAEMVKIASAINVDMMQFHRNIH